MGLFGNKREKSEKVDKYEYHASSKGARGGAYGPPAILAGAPPSPYLSGAGQGFYDGFGQVAGGQGKMGKYGKYGGPSKSLYGMGDPMQQAMLLPPQSSAAIQAQAAAMLQMQQYMQGQAGPGAQFAGVLPPIQMPLAAAQQAGIIPNQVPSYFSYGAQPGATPSPYFDPNTFAFHHHHQQQQQQQQQGAFAPYQQVNMYDPSAGGAYAGPYGYIPAAY